MRLKNWGVKAGFKVYGANPVLTVGVPGEWDAGVLGSMTVLKVRGTKPEHGTWDPFVICEDGLFKMW